MIGIELSPAQQIEIREISRTLGRAFQHDPVMRWLIPDGVARRQRLMRFFATVARHHHLAAGGAEVARTASAIGAAALWDPPGRWRYTTLEKCRAVPGLLSSFGSRIGLSFEVNSRMERVHPEEPHWYLAVIGSDPTVRGGGFGQALMRSRLDRCDSERVPAYLESSNPHNVPYYRRFGFEIIGEITLPHGGPSLWPMWRRPQ
jgi:GNAT superfamily N-acetyltransferase